MDNLQEIIKLLPENYHEEFLQYIQRYKNKSVRKDVDLYALLKSGSCKTAREYTQQLYGKHQLNNYQALRKRLLKNLADFLMQKYQVADQTASSLISGYLGLIRFLADQNHNKLVWVYLKKAEQLAAKNEHYDLLNIIYNLQVEHSGNKYADDLNTILANKKKFKEIAEQEERFSIICAIVRQKLRQHKYLSNFQDLDNLVNKLFDEYEIKNETILNAKSVFNLLTITRSVSIGTKDFYGFEPYLLLQFKQLEDAEIFNKGNHWYRLNILFMIAHTLYRNRKFEQSFEFQQKLSEELTIYNEHYVKHFYVKICLLKASTLAYLRNAQEAIYITENLLINYPYLKEEERLGSLLNLGFYYFLNGDHKEANNISHRIGHTDSWCEKKMGAEWVLKKNLMEIIIQFEIGHFDIAMNRIKRFKVQFKSMIHYPIYQRVTFFLQYISKAIRQPDYFESQEFKNSVQQNLTNIPEEQEDLQAMAFYSWLKSKMNKSDYYEALIDTVT